MWATMPIVTHFSVFQDDSDLADNKYKGISTIDNIYIIYPRHSKGFHWW